VLRGEHFSRPLSGASASQRAADDGSWIGGDPRVRIPPYLFRHRTSLPGLLPIVAPTSTTSTYQWAGTIGVENADGSEGTMVLEHCAPACTHDDFPTDHVVRFTSGASLRVEGMEAERTGYAGRPLPLRYTLANVGSKPAEGFTVQYWVSRTPEITPESFSMGYDERTWTLDGRTSTTVTAAPRIPIEV